MQKIWLWVSVVMFTIPEILWSSTANIIYSMFGPIKNGYSSVLRNNFLFNYNYEYLLKIILSIQFLSIISFIICWLSLKKTISRLTFWLILIISCFALIITSFAFYLGIVFNLNLL
jgi:hypothetical protein